MLPVRHYAVKNAEDEVYFTAPLPVLSRILKLRKEAEERVVNEGSSGCVLARNNSVWDFDPLAREVYVYG